MKTLFNARFNWFFYFGIIFIIRVLWIDISWFSFFALCIFLHQFLLLFFSIGFVLPIRYILGLFMCLQMLLGPTFAYNGLDIYQPVTYKMKIAEDAYFSYALPAVICFIIGLHLTAGKLTGEVLNLKAISGFVDTSGDLAYWFIGIGFLSSILAGYFSSELIFVFYLLGNFKFIGAYMLILSTKQLKTSALVLVFGSIFLSSLGEAMFHDLLTWLIMTGALIAIKLKPSIGFKAMVTFVFIILAVIIQQLKEDYRKSALGAEVDSGLDRLETVYAKKQDEGGIFNYAGLAQSNVRINQGFIITNIMNNVPNKVPFSNGEELYQILEAAFLPRILAPNKLNAGDRTIFMKYSGMRIKEGTSMGLSSMGDAYINFGVLGGCIFMFFLGLLFSEVLNAFYKYSQFYPILLLFTPLVFYYPIRPDCELQTSLGHLVKSCFLIFVLLKVWKTIFKVNGKKIMSS